MEEQLEFKFAKDIDKKNYEEGCMKEIEKDARKDFINIMNKYMISETDRKSIEIACKWM